ncbi:MAG: hypothetical protein ABIY55_09590 [Kofleriaceae bacterium]
MSRADEDPWRDAIDHVLDTHHDDCVWDPAHGRVCPGAGGASRDAVCALLHQQFMAAQALVMSSPTGRSTLGNVLLASRARAQRLGCPIDDGGAARARDPRSASGNPGPSNPADASKPPPGGPPPADPPADPPPPSDTPALPMLVLQPACTSEDDGHGNLCLVCPGHAPMCGGTKCRRQEVATGIVCTLCVDETGFTFADCPAPPATSCHSEISETFRVCSTCDGQPGPPECLPAQCTGTEDGCLRCVDPKDRSATDCTRDPIYSGGAGGDTEFGSCSNDGGLTCNYAGLQTCVVNEYPDWHCLACDYRDSSGGGVCMSASEPIPDPFWDRPKNLPAPGRCVLEYGIPGVVTCATCTRADMSATTSCR